MTLTPVLTSVLAKGRSGGGVSVHGIEDVRVLIPVDHLAAY